MYKQPRFLSIVNSPTMYQVLPGLATVYTSYFNTLSILPTLSVAQHTVHITYSSVQYIGKSNLHSLQLHHYLFLLLSSFLPP